MDKNIILMLVALAALGGGAWYQHRSGTAQPPATAIAKGTPGHPVTKGAAAVPAKPAADTDAARQQAAEQAVRTEIETALHAMKVSSILLGDPAVVIINKDDYGVGSPLKLLGGKILQITGIDESGVALAYQSQKFHLDPPGAPDLAASRKPR